MDTIYSIARQEEQEARRLWPRALVALLLALLVLGCSAPAQQAAPSGNVDAVLVEKAARRLTLMSSGGTVRTYRVALGREPVGPKVREGDNRTPEGSYIIDRRNPSSAFHLALHVSYPNPSDVKRAAALGVSPGADIMIHGIRNGLGWLGPAHRLLDWTRGCIAVTDAEIQEIARLVPDGTPVEIRP
jgi:murein L,D-transpeptidase YafK